ncbi:MAG: recombinase family protein [Deltaproteobacteria bacterium]
MYSSQVKIKYFAYCRKSTEDSKRQVASINDQKSVILTLVERENLNLIGDPFTEEKSAKKPGRQVFNEMLDRIEKEEANGILCWDIDRLYRNPIDEGRLRWMLQNGIIKEIRTPYRMFYPDDAGLLMGVEGGRATDYVIRLSKNVKRAFGRKLNEGWRPGPAPVGYMNMGETGAKIIVPDPERFELIRKMWDLMLTGNYSVLRIRDIATHEWGLRTRATRKMGGKPLSMSHIYKIFSDTFYYGWYLWKDPDTGEQRLYQGMHQPMITEQEFARIQILLGKNTNPRPKKRTFPYSGLMRCGECTSSITAEEKNQLICDGCKHKFSYENKTSCPKCDIQISEMRGPKFLHYVYYHCTKKKNTACTQKSIRVKELERQYNEQLLRLKIDKDYFKLALDYLRETQMTTAEEEKAIRQSLQKAYDNCQIRINNLNKEYTSPQNENYALYSPDEFKSLKGELLKERNGIEQELKNIKHNLDRTYELSERTFNFCVYASYHFTNGDFQTKKEIFSAIGSNLTLKDGKLRIEALEPYILIENALSTIHDEISRFEPNNNGFNKRKEAAFAASIPIWLGTLEDVRTWIYENQGWFDVPVLVKILRKLS